MFGYKLVRFFALKSTRSGSKPSGCDSCIPPQSAWVWFLVVSPDASSLLRQTQHSLDGLRVDPCHSPGPPVFLTPSGVLAQSLSLQRSGPVDGNSLPFSDVIKT